MRSANQKGLLGFFFRLRNKPFSPYNPDNPGSQKKRPVILDFLRPVPILIISFCQNKPELRRFGCYPNVFPGIDPKNPGPPKQPFSPIPWFAESMRGYLMTKKV
jgi:hypothetical protein